MQEKARRIVMDYFNSHVDVTDGVQITMDDVYIVWFSKTLQNWKYLGTTQYEGTKALDTAGLSFNNSGTVRVQIRVSKPGYLPQIRDYDIRSVIDEKEVSGFIQLVKEE